MSILETPSAAGPAWMTSELDEEWPASPPPVEELSPSSDRSAANKSALADKYGSIKWLGGDNSIASKLKEPQNARKSASTSVRNGPAPHSGGRMTSSWGAGLEVDDQQEDQPQATLNHEKGTVGLWSDEEDTNQEADEKFEDARDHLHNGGVASRRPSGQQHRLASHGSVRRTPSSSTTGGKIASRVFSPSTALNERINHGYLASSLVPSPPHSSSSAGSSDGSPATAAGGTFIVRSDSPAGGSSMIINGTSRVHDDSEGHGAAPARDDSPPAFLRQLRQNQQQQQLGGGGGGALFEPLALERMFVPPPPPSSGPATSSSAVEQREQDEEPTTAQGKAWEGSAAEQQITAPQGSIRSAGSGSVSLYAQARRPGLPFGGPSSNAAQPQRASSSSSFNPYAPRYPSGLSRSMTPPSPSLSADSRRTGTSPSRSKHELQSAAPPSATNLPPSSAGSSSARQADDEMDDEERRQGEHGGTVRINSKVSYLPSPRRFSGQADSMQDVDFSFSPPLPSHRPVTPPSGGQGQAFKLFQLRPDTFTKNHLTELVEQMSAHGTPVKEYAGRVAPGQGRRSRRKSPRSASSLGMLSAEKYRQDRRPQSVGSDSMDDDGSEPRSSKRIRLSGGEEGRLEEVIETPGRLSSFLPPVTQPKRTSWGERGEDLLNKIKRGGYASPSVSAASFTPSSSGRSPAAPVAVAHGNYQGGTHRSDPSSGSGTVTSQYASNGQEILDRIKSRKVSESSGVGTGTDEQGGARERVLSDRSARANTGQDVPERAFKRLDLSEVKEVEEISFAPSTQPSTRKPHPPPPVAHGRALNVHHIAPSDLPRIPEQVGRMMFDRHQLRWVKAVSGSSAAFTDPSSSISSGDVFEGIESFRDTHVESSPAEPPEATLAEVAKPAPASVLKKAPLTPAPNKAREASIDSAKRNVSFSDGRKSGKMRDIAERSAKRLWQAKDIEVVVEDAPISPPTPSRRTASGSRQLSLSSMDDVMATPMYDVHLPERSLISRLRASGRKQADTTFLTECSFTVAHDKLVEIITEVQPFEPHWEQLTKIDLSKKGANSLARLKEFLPILDEANLNDNEISYLSGIPATIRTLFVAGNRLTSLTAVNHLANLQYLDISRNSLESVNQLSCLEHLRELRLDHNSVSDIKDLLSIDSLVKVSCIGNKLTELDFTHAKWERMETMDLSCNTITTVKGLDRLASLNTLSLESNAILDLAIRSMPAMRILKISGNKLSRIPLSCLPRLRTLYADGNRIEELGNMQSTPSKLETVSVRNQLVKHFRIAFSAFPDLKRLYISGNDLATDFFPLEPVYSLAYLEAVACKLTRWPQDFAAVFANLRYINLNYNLMPDLDGVEGLRCLKKLSMLGNRVGCDGLSEVIEQLRSLPRLQEIDLRMNPCTLNFYMPVMAPQTSIVSDHGATADSGARTRDGQAWTKMDANFRNTLPDAWYCKRLTYRSLIAMACTAVNKVDGLDVTKSELKKGRTLIELAVEDDKML